MTEVNKNSGGQENIPDGGKGTVLSIDNPKDVALLRRAINQRWPISNDKRAEYLQKLHEALSKCESPRDTANIVKVLVAAEAQNQADEHLHDKNKRIDDGKPTEVVRELRVEFDK